MDPLLESLVPLVVLELSLDVPAIGWNVYLADRDIAITLDDLGREAVSRDDARMLIAEKRENEARARK
jgi:hypothetical protein